MGLFFFGGDDHQLRSDRSIPVPKEWRRKSYRPTDDEFPSYIAWLLSGNPDWQPAEPKLTAPQQSLEEYLDRRESLKKLYEPISLPQRTRRKRERLTDATVLPFPKIPHNWKNHEEQVTAAFKRVASRHD